MIKKKVKKVTYKVWEECAREGCEGQMEELPKYWKDWYSGVCSDCHYQNLRMRLESPRLIEEYEEVNE